MSVELSRTEMHHILERFEKLQTELSYETIPHTKVSPDYNMCIAIPVGAKCYAWITFLGAIDVCFLMEINKERKISRITYTVIDRITPFTNGTLLYGTYRDNLGGEFVVEDIMLFRGISAKHTMMNEKLGFLYAFLQESFPIRFYLPAMWHIAPDSTHEYFIPPEYESKYPVHHIQYRCLRKIAPFLNVYPAKKGFQKQQPAVSKTEVIELPYRHANFTKPQYRQPAIFKVRADLRFDIYHLFAYGSQKSEIYFNVAYIPTYRSSVFMNSIFRNIRENANLDAIEESDDEEDFENVDPEKYVDLKKSVFMECRFHSKFKKWVPYRVVSNREKVVHISQL